MNICATLRILFFAVLCKSAIPDAYDQRCGINLDSTIPLSKCSRQRWFFNRRIRVCTPSCNEAAPFSSKIECQGTCRSVPQHITSSRTENAPHGPRLPSYVEILQLQHSSPSSRIPALKIAIPSEPPTKDIRCKTNAVPTALNHCLFKRWYYDESKRACLPTCSMEAPFINKLACDGVCRSAEVCQFPTASFPCFKEVHPVFIYNPNDQSCFKSFSCSYFGNKFPTLNECRQTCKKCTHTESLGCSTANTSQRNDHTHNLGLSHANPTLALYPGSPNSVGLIQHKQAAMPVGSSDHVLPGFSDNSIAFAGGKPLSPAFVNANDQLH
uniref:Pancreatic trypsin inhibitor n=1 Tax=Rhipicephalus appendiculatus TaxID=34631 RepID=A0A131YQ50_RHIAP